VHDSYVLPADVDILAVLPHAHYLAQRFLGTVTLPDGATRTLLEIPQWDFNWQSDYRFREPVFLPKGSRLDMTFVYDNSTNNIRNPQQPPVRVGFGLQSADEMAEWWIQLLPRQAADRQLLEADSVQRLVREVIAFNTMTLRQNPTNAHAHVQLAKALLTTGRKDDAFAHLRRAVELNPNEEEGYYHLGVVLMETQPIGAESAFLETIRINPENFKAHNNLGLILMRTGRRAAARAEFETALRLNPGDSLILENLKLVQ
jgi:tetratricopeptide (TPR) repeat protein